MTNMIDSAKPICREKKKKRLRQNYGEWTTMSTPHARIYVEQKYAKATIHSL